MPDIMEKEIIDFCNKNALESEDAKNSAISYLLGCTCFTLHLGIAEDEGEILGFPEIVSIFISDDEGIYVLMEYDTGDAYLYLNPLGDFNMVKVADYDDTREKLKKAFTVLA